MPLRPRIPRPALLPLVLAGLACNAKSDSPPPAGREGGAPFLAHDARPAADTLLRIDSAPRKAHVFVDDKHSGRTPVEVGGLTAGVHRVRIESRGHALFETDKRVREGYRESLFVKLVERGKSISPTVTKGGRAPSGTFYSDDDADDPAIDRTRP